MKTSHYAVTMTVLAAGLLGLCGYFVYQDIKDERDCSKRENVHACHKEWHPDVPPQTVYRDVVRTVEVQPDLLPPPAGQYAAN